MCCGTHGGTQLSASNECPGVFLESPYLSRAKFLSYDVESRGDMTPSIKTDNPLSVLHI